MSWCAGLTTVVVLLLSAPAAVFSKDGAHERRQGLITSLRWDEVCSDLVAVHCPDAPQSSDPDLLWSCVTDHRNDATASDECAAAVLDTAADLVKARLFVDPDVCLTTSVILNCGVATLDPDCLADDLDRIKDFACEQQVRRYVSTYGAVFGLGGEALQSACGADKAALCGEVQDRDAAVHLCLMSKYTQLKVRACVRSAADWWFSLVGCFSFL
jgi:hypothetical protein